MAILHQIYDREMKQKCEILSDLSLSIWRNKQKLLLIEKCFKNFLNEFRCNFSIVCVCVWTLKSIYQISTFLFRIQNEQTQKKKKTKTCHHCIFFVLFLFSFQKLEKLFNEIETKWSGREFENNTTSVIAHYNSWHHLHFER